MTEFLIEVVRILIVPILIGLTTIKISNTHSEKKDKQKSLKQANIFVLRLTKLINLLNERKEIIRQIKSNELESQELKLGIVSYDSTEYPGIEEKEYIAMLDIQISDMKMFSLVTNRERVVGVFELLKTTSVDSIDNEFHKDCYAIKEMDLKELFNEKDSFSVDLQRRLLEYTII